MHATRMKSMLVFLTTTLALALALVVPPDVSVSYSQTAPTHYLPSVVVYWPSFTREIGGLPMMPTITTLVEPNSRTFPIHLKTLRLPVQVTLNANQHDTMFQSVTLHVLGTAGQTQRYHKDYAITQLPVLIARGHFKTYRTTINVPPKSGIYTVMADSQTFDPVQRHELEDIIIVDRGGYNRTGVIRKILRKKSGDVELTVTRIEMTPSFTRIYFYLSGAAARYQSQPWGNWTDVIEQVTRSGTIIPSVLNGFSFGPIGDNRRGGYWEGDPTQTDTKVIRFTLQLALLPTSGVKVERPFVVNIPVPKQK